MTYAIISCGKCKHQRMIDRSSASSKCSYCGLRVEHKEVVTVFENKDQNIVRDALTQLNSFDVQEKKSGVDHDPLSTLIYKYENCTDMQKKMELISRGLTDIYGTFSLEDVEKIDEKNAEKLLNAMLELCYVHEVRNGRYRA
jgi:DNA-directed RNA polymerase subunit RPC12/RpoP